MMQTDILEERHAQLAQRADADITALEAIRTSALDWWQQQNLPAVLRLNPYAISQKSGLSVDRLVPELLHGVKQGVFDLHWDAHCPHCNMVTQEVHNLRDARGLGHCDMCAVDFEVDFVSRVEANFSYNSEILDLQLPPVCEIPATLQATPLIESVSPGQSMQAEITVQPGEYKYFCPITQSQGILTVAGERQDEIQQLDLHQLEGRFGETTLSARPGPIRFQLHNQCASPAGLVMRANRLGPQLGAKDTAPRMSGLELIHYPLFQQLFGDQAPSERERLQISAVTTLFTDITGSTELYTSLGDTRAYNLVRDHFNILFEEIEKQGGVVIKTIGDSVMASFRSNTDALQAIIPMQQRLNEYNQKLP